MTSDSDFYQFNESESEPKKYWEVKGLWTKRPSLLFI